MVKLLLKGFDLMITRLHSAIMMTVTSLIGVFLSQSLFVSGYEITAEGKVIGFVEKSEDFKKIADEIDNEISDTYGIDSDIEQKLNIVKKTGERSSVSSGTELWENISISTGLMAEAYVLSVSGEEILAFSQYSDMITILGEILGKYQIDDGRVEFVEEVEYEKKYVSRARICSYDEAKEFMSENNPVTVKTTVISEYRAAVGFETIKQEDKTMYKGSKAVIREGVTGESLVTDEICYIDGEEISRKTIKEDIITNPVSEIVSIGVLDAPVGFGTGSFAFPIDGTLTSGFGERWGRLHGGIDIAADTGTNILASDNGKVIFADVCGSYGLLMKVDHGNGYITYYAHCSGFIAQVGDCVSKGEAIALIGSTGNSTGPHCHFEIRYNGEQLNPLEFLS